MNTGPSILGLHHVQISIPPDAEDDGRRFYVDVLGLREVPKPEALRGRGGFWVQVGDRELHVGTEEGIHRGTTKAHVAYRVAGLAHWRRRLHAAGVEILESAPISGYDRFEFRDPFGNRVEMIEPSDEPPARGPQ